jgi:hypothetical protein
MQTVNRATEDRKNVVLFLIIVFILFVTGCESPNLLFSAATGQSESNEGTSNTRKLVEEKSAELLSVMEETEIWRNQTNIGIYEITAKYCDIEVPEVPYQVPDIDFESLTTDKQDALIGELGAFLESQGRMKPQVTVMVFDEAEIPEGYSESPEFVYFDDYGIDKSRLGNYEILRQLLFNSMGVEYVDAPTSRANINIGTLWNNDWYEYCFPTENITIRYKYLGDWYNVNANPLETAEKAKFESALEEWEDCPNTTFTMDEEPYNAFYRAVWEGSTFGLVFVLEYQDLGTLFGEGTDGIWGFSTHIGEGGPKQAIVFDEDHNDTGDNRTPLHEIGHSLGFWHEAQRMDAIEYLEYPPLHQGIMYGPFDWDSIMMKGGYAIVDEYEDLWSPPRTHTWTTYGISTRDAAAIGYMY